MRRFLSMLVLAFTVAAAASAQSTLLSFNSQPGDFIGQGQQRTLTPSDGTITASGSSANGVSVSFSSASEFWSLAFHPPAGVALQPGMFEEATRYPFQTPTHPGLSVSGDGRGCNTLTGRFVVLEAVYGSGNTVQKLAVDYEQHCEGGAAALFGSVRINSSVTVEPRLSVSSPKVYEGDSGIAQMHFVISLSAPAPGPVSVDYATADGTATAGADYTSVSGTANFAAGQTAVAVMVPVAGDLIDEADETFTLSVQNPAGAIVAFGQGVGTIVDDDPLKTLFFFNSQPGDYIGQGQRFTLTPVDGTFSASGSSSNLAALSFAGADSWTANFAAPGSAPLTPGVYTGAARYPFQPSNSPGMNISGAGRGCNTLTGQFTVLEAVYGTGGALQRFAADYEQHCEGGAPALAGSVRYNSTFPLPPQPNDYYTVTPCRLLDTRLAGTAVAANTTKTFAAGGLCGVPLTATAVVVNITAVAPTDAGDLRLYAAGSPAPLAVVLTFSGGRTLASNAVGALGAGGNLAVQNDMPAGSLGSTHVVVDVVGYFQ
jgi:hypothetical protein